MSPSEIRFDAERGRHSAKPPGVRDHILRMCPRPGRPLELFARAADDARFDYAVSDQLGVEPGTATVERAPKRTRRELEVDVGPVVRGPRDVGVKVPKRTRCLLVDVSRTRDLARLDLGGYDSLVIVRTTCAELRDTVAAIHGLGLEYKTLVFYAYDPTDPTLNEFWLGAAGSKFKVGDIRLKFRSQLVEISGRDRTSAVREAAREAFGDVAGVRVPGERVETWFKPS